MASRFKQLFAEPFFIIGRSSSFLKVLFPARDRKSVMTCHICTRFGAYLHSKMLLHSCRIIKAFLAFHLALGLP